MIHFLDEGVKVIKGNSLGGACEIKPIILLRAWIIADIKCIKI